MAGLAAQLRATLKAYDEAQHPRDEHGHWRSKDATPDVRKALRVPPAWTDVKVHHEVTAQNPTPEGAMLLAIGRDAKGREQRVYSAAHHQRQAAAKYERVRALHDQIPLLDEHLAGRRGHDNADALTLIRHLGLRPGSTTDTKAEKQAYGASTLERRHVSFLDRHTAELHFTGKKGVDITLRTSQPEVVSTLRERHAATSAAGDRLFPRATDQGMRDELQGALPDFKVKDLRTHVGTGEALRAVAETPRPDSPRALQKAKRAVAQRVSNALGNTPTVALQSYIDPTVFMGWEHAVAKTVFSTDTAHRHHHLNQHFATQHYFPAFDYLPADPDPDHDDNETAETLGKAALDSLFGHDRLLKAWDPSKHPRDMHGKFIRVGQIVELLSGTKGQVIGVDAAEGRVRVNTADGVRTVAADSVTVRGQLPAPPGAHQLNHDWAKSMVESLGRARAAWLKRVAQMLVPHLDPSHEEHGYWSGVHAAELPDANTGGKPKPGGGKPGGKPKKPTLGDAEQLHTKLSAAGEDISDLNPMNVKLPPGQTPGHVQMLLYDLAVGARSGNIPQHTPKVVPTSTYLEEITNRGLTNDVKLEFFPYRVQVYVPAGMKEHPTHPASLPEGTFQYPKSVWMETHDRMEAELLVASNLGTYYGNDDVSEWAKENLGKSVLDYVRQRHSEGKISVDLALNATHKWKDVERRRKLQYDEALKKRTNELVAELRRRDHSVPWAVNLPRFDQVAMQEQTFEDIQSIIERHPGGFVPTFYTYSSLENGALYHGTATRHVPPTWEDHPPDVGDRFSEANPHGVGRVTYEVLGVSHGEVTYVALRHKTFGASYHKKMSYNDFIAGKTTAHGLQGNSHTVDVKRTWAKTGVDKVIESPMAQSRVLRGSGDSRLKKALEAAGAHTTVNSKNIDPGYSGSGKIYAGVMYLLRDGDKVVEYVSYSQPQQGAPRNQRGRLTLEGYTPEEAFHKLKALGVIQGDLEPQVPFNVVMRSPRRDGLVLPLHSAYIRGDARPPESKYLLSHGLTGTRGDALASLEAIASGGGLLSIAERYKHGIKVHSSSPAGDIRSGIDHVNFCSHNSGSGCGSSSQIRIGLRADTMLRHDIVVADHDYGAMGSRYTHYLKYKKQLQRAVNEPESKNLYDDFSPAVRAEHLRRRSTGYPGSAEFNVGGSIPVEDWEIVGVKTEDMKAKVEEMFKKLLESGRVSRIPNVVIGQEFEKAVTQ